MKVAHTCGLTKMKACTWLIINRSRERQILDIYIVRIIVQINIKDTGHTIENTFICEHICVPTNSLRNTQKKCTKGNTINSTLSLT